MTPANPSTRGPINDGWIVYGTMLSDCFCQPADALQAAPLADAIRGAGLIRRLRACWSRPAATPARFGSSHATDAATHLEIVLRGGRPR